MVNDTFLVQLLTSIGYLLPDLLACAIGGVLLASTARPGVARRRGYLGLGLLLTCLLLRLACGLYQAWLINSAATMGTGSLPSQFGVLGVVRFVADCVGAAGLVVLVTGLCRASRDQDASRLPHASPGRRP